MTTSPPSFEVFTPLQPRDEPEGPFREVAERITQVVHGVFAEIEAEALPAAEGATVVSETAALIRALPSRDAQYDVGHVLISRSRFSIPFATTAEWGEPAPGEAPIDPVVTFDTSVTVWSDNHDSEVLKSILAMRRSDPNTPEGAVVTIEDESLMGVAGEPVGGRFRRRYRYAAKQQAEVRTKIQEAFAEDEAARVDATTFVGAPIELGVLFGFGPSIDLRSSRSLGRGGAVIEPTTRELVIPSLRVVCALLSRGAA